MHPEPKFPAVYHVGFVVPHVDDALEAASALSGPLDVYRRFDLDVRDVEYRGRQVWYTADVALYDSDNVRMELIAPLSGVSPYHDHLAAHDCHPSIHHIAYVVPSIEERIAEARERGADARLVLTDLLPSGQGRFAYYEGLLTGIVVELLERWE